MEAPLEIAQMPTMKDNEIRGVVLQEYYARRRDGYFQWAAIKQEKEFQFDWVDLYRICDQLAEHGLIDWNPVPGAFGQTMGGIGKISAFGVDVIEGTEKPPISITLADHSQHIEINESSNIQIGNSNTLEISTHVDQLLKAIDNSNAPAPAKAEAKSLFGDFLKHPVIAAIIGGFASSINK